MTRAQESTVDAEPSTQRSAALVVLAGWLVPGAGYLLLGERVRALTIGLTIAALFVAGILIGGLRVLEVPGYGPHGRPIDVVWYRDREDGLHENLSEDPAPDIRNQGWIMRVHPLDEVRNKPWSIAQIMNGPLGIAAGIGSVLSSEQPASGGPAPGVRSHSRVNDIGVLYTAVAGMLNLLAIIDSAHRAGQDPE